LDDAQDMLLLVTRQAARALKDLAQLACRAGAARLGRGKKLLGSDTKNDGDLLDLFRPERDRMPFPDSVSGLGDAELVGDLSLAEARGFAQGVQTGSKRAAWILGRSASLHALIIRAGGLGYENGLHSYEY